MVRALVAVLSLLLAASCIHTSRNRPDAPLFSILAPDKIVFVFAPASGLRFVFRTERSPTTERLRAVVISGAWALAVGDHGTIVRRGRATAWVRETSSSREDLYGVAPSSEYGMGWGYVAGKVVSVQMLAVGARGTILARGAGTTWHAEPSPTRETLFSAAVVGGERVVAVGAHGAVLARQAGAWQLVSSGTTEDLLAITPYAAGFLASGRHGALVHCVWMQRTFSCTPLAPGVEAELIGSGTLQVEAGDQPVIVSREGEVYLPADPPAAALTLLTRLSIASRGIATPRWYSTPHAPTLVVGDHGQIATVLHGKSTAGSLPQKEDLRGVTFTEAEGFIVGDAGTILRVDLESVPSLP